MKNRTPRILGLTALAFSLAASAAWSQSRPDFSGQWKQDNERCQPKRTGEVTLKIEQHEPVITIETNIARKSAASRHALQRYTTDGKVSVSTGADGDEFHTSITWKDSSLVFSIEEHEDGRILHSKETWSVLENGNTLERIREQPNGEKQTLIYIRLNGSSM